MNNQEFVVEVITEDNLLKMNNTNLNIFIGNIKFLDKAKLNEQYEELEKARTQYEKMTNEEKEKFDEQFTHFLSNASKEITNAKPDIIAEKAKKQEDIDKQCDIIKKEIISKFDGLKENDITIKASEQQDREDENYIEFDISIPIEGSGNIKTSVYLHDHETIEKTAKKACDNILEGTSKEKIDDINKNIKSCESYLDAIKEENAKEKPNDNRLSFFGSEKDNIDAINEHKKQIEAINSFNEKYKKEQKTPEMKETPLSYVATGIQARIEFDIPKEIAKISLKEKDDMDIGYFITFNIKIGEKNQEVVFRPKDENNFFENCELALDKLRKECPEINAYLKKEKSRIFKNLEEKYPKLDELLTNNKNQDIRPVSASSSIGREIERRKTNEKRPRSASSSIGREIERQKANKTRLGSAIS